MTYEWNSASRKIRKGQAPALNFHKGLYTFVRGIDVAKFYVTSFQFAGEYTSHLVSNSQHGMRLRLMGKTDTASEYNGIWQTNLMDDSHLTFIVGGI